MSAEKFYWQGKNLFDQENYEEALKHFQLALKANQQHLNSLHGRALSYFKLTRLEQSIQDFDKLIELEPHNAVYLSDRGVALHLSGQNEKAILDFDKAVELEPENPYRYSSRAYVKERMQDYQGAVDDYTRAIELDPEDAIAYNNRGLVEEKLGYQESAKRSFKQADRLVRPAQKTLPGNTKEESKSQKNLHHTTPLQKERKPAVREYVKVMRSVFSSRHNLKDFMDFVSSKFRSNK